MNFRDDLKRRLPDFALLCIGFLTAKWWGLLFAAGCVAVSRSGTKALVVNALCVLAAMVIAVVFEGVSSLDSRFVTSRSIANEFGLLLVIAVIAIVIPRPHSGR